MKTGCPVWWEEAKAFLLQDEILSDIVKRYPEEHLSGRGDVFFTFVRSIVGQQISVVAADSVFQKLEKKVGKINSENITKFSVEELASCGISRPKAGYILGVANDIGNFLRPDLEHLTDDELHSHLISFKGIGPWTAEMIMIFSFLRPNIFSPGDVGLINSVKRLCPNLETKDEVVEFSKRWSPYKTAACWYLWRILDPVPVEY